MAKFMVNYTFHGRGTEIIEAESMGAAEDMIEQKTNSEAYEPDADELEIVSADISEMHPVTRDGKEIWTTYIKSTDQRGHHSELSSTSLFASGVGS